MHLILRLLATLLLTLALEACASSAEPTSLPATDACTVETPDAATPSTGLDASAPEDCAAQHAKICSGGAECGITWACNGELWSCGVCDVGSCGDNGRLNKCGLECRGTNYADACIAAGAPSAYGVALSCLATPYKLDGEGKMLFRPARRTGCEVTNGLLCCPP
jgi:hypothetical protein